MKKAFVTGWPVSHSKSPVLHGFWLREYGIEGTYEAIPVEPDAFPDFVKDLPNSEFCGGNVTIPHKEIAFENIADLDDAAQAIGAVNTIWIEDGVIRGSNTDAYGFSANLDDYAANWRSGSVATVLGAGGASRAIIYALLIAGYEEVRIVNRTLARAQTLVSQFGGSTSAHGWDKIEALLQDCDLLVNTTSIGMNPGKDPPIPKLSGMKDSAIVTDIVYTPLITPLLQSAAERELETVDGLGMLLHQAVPGFEKWFGKEPEVTEKLRSEVMSDT